MFDLLRRSMMARILTVGVVAAVTSGSQVSCSSGDGSRLDVGDIHSGSGPTYTTTLTLRNSAGAETYSFQRGELITFELTLRNRTRETVHLDFASGQQWNFFVFNSGWDTPRWRWSDDQVFTQAATRITLAPGESRVFSITWNQISTHTGEALPPGAYEALGVIWHPTVAANPLASHELGSTFRAFTVF
jgi:hypothetical protein